MRFGKVLLWMSRLWIFKFSLAVYGCVLRAFHGRAEICVQEFEEYDIEEANGGRGSEAQVWIVPYPFFLIPFLDNKPHALGDDKLKSERKMGCRTSQKFHQMCDLDTRLELTRHRTLEIQGLQDIEFGEKLLVILATCTASVTYGVIGGSWLYWWRSSGNLK